MEVSDIIKYLELETDVGIDQLTKSLNTLSELPHSFLTLNWHESHEFLWISPKIEELSGYNIENFKKLGIPFILSITPKKLIPEVTEVLGNWRKKLDSDPGEILNSVIMEVPGGLEQPDGTITDLSCHSLVMDYSPGKIISYFMLTVSFDKQNNEIEQTIEQGNRLLRNIHELYMQMKPNRFKMLNAYFSLTTREKEISELISNGDNSGEIAGQLNISLGTVNSHRKNILRKLGAKNTAEMVQLLNKVLG